MLSGRKKIYRSRTPLRIAVTTLIIILVLFVLVSAIVFFSFQKYIVYTADGLRLEVPWLEDSAVDEEETENAVSSDADTQGDNAHATDDASSE